MPRRAAKGRPPIEASESIFERHPLDALFAPTSIALIGASDRRGTVGRLLHRNLTAGGYAGSIVSVNPAHPKLSGQTCFPTIGDVPHPIDLAVIATPATTVPALVEACARAGVQSALVISAGFRETGSGGRRLEERIAAVLEDTPLRLLGPNSLGVMMPRIKLNASLTRRSALAGNVAFLSESATLGNAILDWSLRERVGFSGFVSIGSGLDVSWGDLITYFGNDPATRSIIIYMESISDPRVFLSAARETALMKPIVLMKPGNTDAGMQAIVTHTGALMERDGVIESALRRCGVLRVQSVAELFYMADLLSRQPRAAGSRLAIVTNAGGPGIIATDALITHGGQPANLSSGAIEELERSGIPPPSSDGPIDVHNDADPETYGAAFRTALEDPSTDAVLAIFTPQANSEPAKTAERIAELAAEASKPVLASWMGGREVAEGTALLNRSGISTFPYPDTAAKMFCFMWRYSHNLDLLYETPSLSVEPEARSERKRASSLLASARKAGHTVLSEAESKDILSAYAIPVVETRIAQTVDDALLAAQEIGYPVVMKVHSDVVTHKMRSGGVRLHLGNTHAVREAYRDIANSIEREFGAEAFGGVTVQRMVYPTGFELLLGCSHDPKFGPVLLFGTGGSSTEIHQDIALGIPPLNATLARRLMERTRIFPAMKRGTIGQKANLVALEQVLVRFSQLIVEQRTIKEIDINPFFVSGEIMMALDARIVLHDGAISLSDLPRLPIRPYPSEYIRPWTAKDKTRLLIRPIRPEDEPLIVDFHKTLSQESVYLRYFQNLKLGQRISHERLRRICFIDYDREMALVAERTDGATGRADIVGVGRLSHLHGTRDGEYAIIVSDAFQGKGLGTELLHRLVTIGRKEGLQRIVATILPENTGMLKISERLGFHIHPKDRQSVVVTLEV